MKKFNFIYITTNLIDKNQYIGEHSTDDLNDSYLGSGIYLTNAIKKHGKNNFSREILELFETKKEAFDNQEKYIKIFNTLSPNGYNISSRGGHNCMSEAMRIKLSNAAKGRVLTEEHKNKISEANKNQIPWCKGKTGLSHPNLKHSEETKKKMRKKHKKMSEASIEKNRINHLKENLSVETRTKMSESAKARIRIRKNPSFLQYDLNGFFIKEINYSELINEYGYNVVSCCKEKRRSACGFIWRYKTDIIENKIVVKPKKTGLSNKKH